MFNWLNNYMQARSDAMKAEEAAEEQTKERILQRDEEKYSNTLKERTDKMLASYCAVRDDNCTKECTHFEAGFVYRGFMTEFAGKRFYPVPCVRLIKPRCRLWKER